MPLHIHLQNRSAAIAPLMREIAHRGVSGPVSRFPYESRIRSGFGRFAPERMEAVRGVRAQAANRALGSSAFAFGPRAAFGAAPDLHTAAHEAAHMAAAPYGVRLTDGVGQAGDCHEQVADQAADAIVAGRSAEPVFETAYGGVAPIHAGGPLLQMNPTKLKGRSNHNAYELPWMILHTHFGVPLKEIKDAIRALDKNPGKGPYSRMLTLGDDPIARPETMLVSVGDLLTGHDRKSQPIQTHIGNLGNFMARITGSGLPYKYQGGHLIGDQFMGEESYDDFNLAPQFAPLNAPSFSYLESLVRGGVKAGPGITLQDEVDYGVQLQYPGPVYIDRKTIFDALNLASQPGMPEGVFMPPWVPVAWNAVVKSRRGLPFATELDVDPTLATGRHQFFEGDDAAFFDALYSDEPDALFHSDVAMWKIDQMLARSPTSSVLSTGSTSRIDFMGAQSAPVGQITPLGFKHTTMPQKYIDNLIRIRSMKGLHPSMFKVGGGSPRTRATRVGTQLLFNLLTGS